MLGSRRPRLKPRGGQIRLGGQQDGLVRIEDRIVQTDQLRSRRIKQRRLDPPSRKDGGERVAIGGHLPQIGGRDVGSARSEEHTSELQSLMRSSYAVFCLKKKSNK